MKLKRTLFWALLALPLLAGCATKQLLDEQSFHEAWPQPHLALAFDASRHDVRVTYDELTEESGKQQRRAYFLFQNEKRTAAKKKPMFVEPTSDADLVALPIFPTAAEALSATNLDMCAVAVTNRPTFELFSKGRKLGEFHLPVYKNGVWEARKALLLPLAVGADATVVGGWLAVLWAEMGGPGLR